MPSHGQTTVAVTGGTGFIGNILVHRLLESGARVRVLTRREPPMSAGSVPHLEFCAGDVRAPATLPPWLEGACIVYHLAAEVRDRRAFAPVNEEGTAHVLDAAHKAGVRRFVFLSSAGVIGADGMTAVVDDATPPRPRSAYEVSKFAAETECLRRNTAAFEVTALRPAVVYGEGRTAGRDSFLSLMRWLRGGRLVLLGPGCISSFVYAGDVAAACLEIARNSHSPGRTFIASEPLPLSEFLAEAAEVLNVRRPPMLPPRAARAVAAALRTTGRFGSLYNATAFSHGALDGLGFQRPFGYRNGLRRTLAWYRGRARL